MNIGKRLKEPTPKFFKKLMRIGMTLAAIGTMMVAPPMAGVVLPAIIQTVGGYLIFGGTVISTVSKLTVTEEPDNKETSQE
jgi:hypothetical protein